MGRKRMVRTPDGRQVQAEELTFRSPGENWTEYLIEDGTLIKIKPVATEVLRVEGEFDPSGNPVYIMNAQQIVVVSAPEELKRQEGE